MIDDNKCKDDPANNDDALKNSNNSIGLTAISNDPRIKRFFTKTYSVVDNYCEKNKLSKRKLCSAIISEIYKITSTLVSSYGILLGFQQVFGLYFLV